MSAVRATHSVHSASASVYSLYSMPPVRRWGYPLSAVRGVSVRRRSGTAVLDRLHPNPVYPGWGRRADSLHSADSMPALRRRSDPVHPAHSMPALRRRSDPVRPADSVCAMCAVWPNTLYSVPAIISQGCEPGFMPGFAPPFPSLREWDDHDA